MRYQDYEKIVKEYFDITDDITRKVMININEADQDKMLSALTNKLYDLVIEKIDDIDFGSIPDTKGDITKLENYSQLLECVDLLNDLLEKFRQPKNPVTIVETAIDNIRNRKELFERGFKFNVELPIVLYSTIVLSIVSSISLLIATCIEFIKEPNQEQFEIVIDKVAISKTRENLLFKNLDKFNHACSKGQIDSCVEQCIKNSTASMRKQLTGIEPVVVIGGAAFITIMLNIIPIIRELIYFFYYSRTQLSDYFELQAELLEVNAYNVAHGNNPDITSAVDRREIANKQKKIAARLKRLSSFFAVKVKTSERETAKAIANDTSKKYKTSELVDDLPDSASSALF